MNPVSLRRDFFIYRLIAKMKTRSAYEKIHTFKNVLPQHNLIYYRNYSF